MIDPRLTRVFLLPILAVLVLAAFSVQDRPKPLRTFQPTQAFSGEQAMTDVNRLAATYPARPAGGPADNDLAREVADAFRAGELETSVHTDRLRTTEGTRDVQQVIGRTTGGSGDVIVIAASRDGLRAGSRAEVTGTATLLEFARLLSQRRINHPVVLASVSGTRGQGGYRALARRLSGGEPVRAVIVLGTLGTTDLAPPVTGFSNGPELASLRLWRTVEESVRTERTVGSSKPSAAAQLARLAAPVTTGGQGALLRAGLPAILFSTTGDRTAPRGLTPEPRRLTADGRAVLRTMIALDNSPPVDLKPEQRLAIADGVIPGWAMRAIVLALLIPTALLVLDGVARARRQRQRLGRWVLWVLSLGLPQLLGLGAVAVGARLGWLDLPGGPIDPAVWDGEKAPLIVFVVVAGVSHLLRPLAMALLGFRGLRTSAPAAPLGLGVVLVVLGLVMWVANPAAAAIAAPAVVFLPVLLDSGVRPPRLWAVAITLLTLIPLALVVVNLLTRFALGGAVSALSWLTGLMGAGDVGLFPQLWFATLSGCCIAAVWLAWNGRSNDLGDAEPTVRGPATYAGPGSLGGVDSALDRS